MGEAYNRVVSICLKRSNRSSFLSLTSTSWSSSPSPSSSPHIAIIFQFSAWERLCHSPPRLIVLFLELNRRREKKRVGTISETQTGPLWSEYFHFVFFFCLCHQAHSSPPAPLRVCVCHRTKKE